MVIMKMKQKANMKLPGLARSAVRSVRCALCWQCRVSHTNIQSEPRWHLSVMMEMTCLHWDEERSELNPVIQQLVFQLPWEDNA